MPKLDIYIPNPKDLGVHVHYTFTFELRII